MNTNMKNYIRNSLSRLGGTSRTAGACLAVALRSRACRGVASVRSRTLLALIAGLGLLPAGRVTAQTFTTLHSFTAGHDPYPFCDCPHNGDGANPFSGLVLSG